MRQELHHYIEDGKSCRNNILKVSSDLDFPVKENFPHKKAKEEMGQGANKGFLGLIDLLHALDAHLSGADVLFSNQMIVLALVMAVQ